MADVSFTPVFSDEVGREEEALGPAVSVTVDDAGDGGYSAGRLAVEGIFQQLCATRQGDWFKHYELWRAQGSQLKAA